MRESSKFNSILEFIAVAALAGLGIWLVATQESRNERISANQKIGFVDRPPLWAPDHPEKQDWNSSQGEDFYNP
jgi:hypothetical protein